MRARAGLDDVRIHDLRHSYASRALALGESLPVIAKLLGHAQIQTTARYTHLTRDAVKDAAIRVARDIAEDVLEGHAPDRTSASRGPGGATRIGVERIARVAARGHAVRGHRVKEEMRASAARIAADIGADILPPRQQSNIPARSGSEADTTAHAA